LGKRKRSLVVCVWVLLVFVSVFGVVLNVPLVKASEIIYIRADGSVVPSTANITSVDNVTYYFSDNIFEEIVVERSNIIMDGNGYTLQGSGSGNGFYWSNINNVTIKNTNIKNFKYGAYLNSSSFNTVSGNNVENNEYGIEFNGSSNNTINGNNVENNIEGVFFLRSSNNTISGNNITMNSFYYGGGLGIRFSGSFKNTIFGNNIQNNDDGISLLVSSNNTISGNNITNNNEYGIVLSLSSNNIISGNNVTNNNFGAESDSIRLYASSNNTVSGNNITANNNYNGITLSSSSNNNTIWRNNITNNWRGISLELFSNNNYICKNHIANNWLSIVFLDYSQNNTISGNNITNNDHGILLADSANNNYIGGNNIANNLYGIKLVYSRNNNIFYNNFIDNAQQVYIETLDYPNNWDNGYPSGGNYWSNYTGADLKSGPNQDQLGSDGIGDTPYIIDGNNRDRYPLMSPLIITHNYDGLWHTEDFAITLTATHISGVAETYYRINDESTKKVSINGQPIITTEGANNKLEYWGVDNIGNEKSHRILTGIKLDKTAPTGSIAINDEADYTTTTSVTLTLSATDTTSGVAEMRFSNDNTEWANWETYATSKSWTLTTDDGAKTIYVQFKDNAGLISSACQDTITLDTTMPTANAGTDQTVNEDTLVTFDASGSSDNIGIVNYTWTFTDANTLQTLTGKNPTYTFQTPGTYIVTLNVTDAAGNYATDTITVTVRSVEGFPMLIVGAGAAITAIAIAVAATLLLRKRKP